MRYNAPVSSNVALSERPSEVFPLMTKAAFEETFGAPEERAARIAGSPPAKISHDVDGLYAWMTESDFEIIFGTREERIRRQRVRAANAKVALSRQVWEKFAGQWIVVSECKVVAAEPTWEALNVRIVALGLDRDWVFIQHVKTSGGARRP